MFGLQIMHYSPIFVLYSKYFVRGAFTNIEPWRESFEFVCIHKFSPVSIRRRWYITKTQATIAQCPGFKSQLTPFFSLFSYSNCIYSNCVY